MAMSTIAERDAVGAKGSHLEQAYFDLLAPWVGFARKHLSSLPGRPESCWYGPAENSHWSVQAHSTALAALATLANFGGYDAKRTGIGADELMDISIRMLRSLLLAHKSTRRWPTRDGGAWGLSWISVLGPERMQHAARVLLPKMTEDDREAYRTVMMSEADWLLDEYPVLAGPVENNKPESNLWNGCHLHRTALLFPDAPRAAAWRDKGTRFLLNSISCPEDAADETLYDGRPVKDWHVGHNLFSSMSCNHHGYMNVGYMVICLSNLSMFHFACKDAGWKAPAALYHNAKRLWDVLKHLAFDDGRLLRVGGDTRARYCYCQDYAIPMWLLARDLWGDDCTAQEKAWIAQLCKETVDNGDGSFLKNRLSVMKESSYLYYVRLEGDRAASLSMGLAWTAKAKALQPVASRAETEIKTFAWEDEYHGVQMVRSPARVASWCKRSALGPTGLCVPTGRSDMAEWAQNLAGRIEGEGVYNEEDMKRQQGISFDGGFAVTGRYLAKTEGLLAEGEPARKDLADVDFSFVALPDGATVVGMQRAVSKQGAYIKRVQGMYLQIPNDVYNDTVRRYESADGMFETRGGTAGLKTLTSPWLTIDGAMTVQAVYGGSLSVESFARRTARMKDSAAGKSTKFLLGGTLYLDDICIARSVDTGFGVAAGEAIFDLGFALRCGGAGGMSSARAVSDGDSRAMRVLGADGKEYLAVTNWGEADATITVEVSQAKQLVPVEDGGNVPAKSGQAAVRMAGGTTRVFRLE